MLHFAIICDFIRNSCQVRLKIALQKNQELKTLKSQAPERLSVIHKIVGDYVNYLVVFIVKNDVDVKIGEIIDT